MADTRPLASVPTEHTSANVGDLLYGARSGTPYKITFANFKASFGLGSMASEDAADFFPSTGGTVSGNVDVTGELSVTGNSDFASTVTLFKAVADSGVGAAAPAFTHASNTTSGFYYSPTTESLNHSLNGAANILFDVDGTTMPNGQTASTRAAGDARWVQLANLNDEIAGYGQGVIGTPMTCIYTATFSGTISRGATTSGSNLRATNALGHYVGAALSGTWRLHGEISSTFADASNKVATWVRIA